MWQSEGTFDLAKLPHKIINDELIIEDFDMLQIKSLQVNMSNPHINSFLRRYEDHLSNLTFLSIMSFGTTSDYYELTFIPKSIRELSAFGIVINIDDELDLKCLTLSCSTAKSKLLLINPYSIKQLIFNKNEYDIPNIDKMENLLTLHIQGIDENYEMNVVSEKLNELTYYGNGVLPLSVSHLTYFPKKFNNNFSDLNLKELVLILDENIEMNLFNEKLPSLKLQICCESISNIKLDFPNITKLIIYLQRDNFEFNHLSKLIDSFLFIDYLCISIPQTSKTHEIKLSRKIKTVVGPKTNIIFDDVAYYSYGEYFNHDVETMFFEDNMYLKELTIESSVKHIIFNSRRSVMKLILKTPFLKTLKILKSTLVPLYIISDNYFEIECEICDIYLNNYLIKEGRI